MKVVKQASLTRALLGIAGAGVMSVGLLASGSAMAGISATKHNLSSTGTFSNHITDSADICVFCHTPHASDLSGISPPLWNKRILTGATYQLYASSTLDARTANDGAAGGGALGSTSIACLTCHDGAQAMDNMINAPGSGGLMADGGGANGQNLTWAASTRVDATGKLLGVANLSGDLRNDHPVGIQYCGGGPTVASPAASCRDPDFVAPSYADFGLGNVFWVDTGGAGRQKTDMILHNRTFAVDGVGPSVECGSCHDPHTSAQPLFLRVSNAGSGVCLACHVK